MKSETYLLEAQRRRDSKRKTGFNGSVILSRFNPLDPAVSLATPLLELPIHGANIYLMMRQRHQRVVEQICHLSSDRV